MYLSSNVNKYAKFYKIYDELDQYSPKDKEKA
jgi:hypothetical protein